MYLYNYDMLNLKQIGLWNCRLIWTKGPMHFSKMHFFGLSWASNERFWSFVLMLRLWFESVVFQSPTVQIWEAKIALSCQEKLQLGMTSTGKACAVNTFWTTFWTIWRRFYYFLSNTENSFICKKPASGDWTTPPPTKPPVGYCPNADFQVIQLQYLY